MIYLRNWIHIYIMRKIGALFWLVFIFQSIAVFVSAQDGPTLKTIAQAMPGLTGLGWPDPITRPDEYADFVSSGEPSWCRWEGIVCRNQVIVILDFDNLNLGRLPTSIPSNISNLSGLTAIRMRNNSISGTIPSSIGLLGTTLLVLDLSYNKLNGTIPNEISKLSRLMHMHLNSNKLVGKIPTALGKLQTTGELYLSNNLLTGSIPSSI